jgi:uncharacterized protein YcbK (DUF882 family)
MAVNDIYISKDFKLSEFQSPDTGEVMLYPELIQKTQKVRDLIGLPVRVDSGYRTKEHNLAVGGVPNSLHCQGKAVDLSCAFVSLAVLTIAAIMAGFPKVIVYTKKNFCHCDLSEYRQYLVPQDWIECLSTIFPQYKDDFKPWLEVQDVSVIEN